MASPALLQSLLVAAVLVMPVAVLPAATAETVKVANTNTALTAAQDYFRHAGIADLFERESSKIALQKSGRDDIKSFAQMMVEDHAKSTEKLRAAAIKDGLAPPETKLDADHAAKLKELQETAADRFDSLYLDMQVKGHTGALALHKDFAASEKDTALKAAAGEIAPVVQQHLEAAKKLAASAKTGSTQ